MKVSLNLVKDFKFEFKSETGHSAILDGPVSIGGSADGLRPMEMILGGLAGCSSFDILSILKKARQDVKSFDVAIRAERRDEIPKIFTEIHLHFKVVGQVEEKHLKRAIDLSIQKYCSVSAMLEKSAKITTEFTISTS